MLQFFRNFMKSTLGVGITLGFLVLLALAFASGDILSFGGVSGSSSSAVAKVGSRKVEASTLDFFARKAVERMQERDPSQSMKTLVSSGGITEVLDGLIEDTAVAEFGRQHGILAGERLIGSELAKQGAFRGNTGKFDDATYRAAIGRQGFTDKIYRQLVSDQIISQQVQQPASFGARVPTDLFSRYAGLASESREGFIALLPAMAFAPKVDPTADEINKFYTANRSKYTQPERRVIRYALFDDKALKAVPAPTDQEIAARYAADKAKYAASELRKLTQLVLPTEAAARAIMGELAKGGTLETAARTKGLATASIASTARDAYATQHSGGVADAVFAASQGSLAGPVKGGLGWYLVRVDGVERKPGKTLDEARSEIVDELMAVKKRAALAEFSERIEGEFDDGAALSDVAKELGVEVKQTAPITADGRVFGHPEQALPPELGKAVQAVFTMDREGQPQMTELVASKIFLVYDVATIMPSAPAPQAEIRQQLIDDWKIEKGGAAAKAAADKVLAAAKKGTDLNQAMAAVGTPLPPVDKVDMRRAELRRGGQAVPPPLALMFAMAKGSVKMMAAPMNRGWYIVSVKTITPGQVNLKEPGMEVAQRQFGGLAGQEYTQQLRNAMREEVGAKKEQKVVDALIKSLIGGN